jgi:hypothetical protein
MGKQLLPLFIGLLIIGLDLLLQVNVKLFSFGDVVLLILFISIAIPIVTFGMRTKNSGDYPAYGCLIGSIVGFFTFVRIINFIMNLFNPNIKALSGMIDLFLGALLGASILSTLGIIAGDWISRHNKR